MQFITEGSKVVGVIHGDEVGIPESQEIVEDNKDLRSFDWIKIDNQEIELINAPLSSIYDRCQQARRSVLRWESAFADYTAEFRKKQNRFVIIRRGNGYA